VQISTPWGDAPPPVRRILSNYFDLVFFSFACFDCIFTLVAETVFVTIGLTDEQLFFVVFTISVTVGVTDGQRFVRTFEKLMTMLNCCVLTN